MIIGISQPTFFPWLGYFGLLDYVDQFIFLDDVQFDKISWQQRNYIYLNNKNYLLTLPVISKGKFYQKIRDVKINRNEDKKKILQKIYSAYCKKKYFNEYYPSIEKSLINSGNNLIDININLIKSIMTNLGITTKLNYSSKISVSKIKKKEELIFEICKHTDATKYITTIGAKKYLNNLQHVPETDIEIKYFNMGSLNIKDGNQHLSVIDLLFNEGPETLNLIRNNLKID